jgi:hypothetical protein
MRRPQRCQRFRQEREERHAQERADGVADEPRNDPCARTVGEEQKRGGEEKPAEAAEQTETERGREQRHATF